MTTFGYDALGQLRWTDGPLPGTVDRVEIEYNSLGHKTRTTDPDKGIWDYRHNALGELTCQRDARGQGQRLVYDSIGRLVQRIDLIGISNLDNCTGTQVGSTVWTFGNVVNQPSFGQVTREVSSHVGNVAGAGLTITLDYVYDARARVSRIDTVLNEGNGQFVRSYVEQFTFDQFGRPFQSFDASGDSRGSRYLYNARGYLERVREAREGSQGQIYWTLTHQDARGNATRAVLGNGMELLRTFNALTGEPESLLDSMGAQVAQNTQLI
ncbi:MAG: hypothetical protein ACXIUM_13085 [Wenzhouxiangella sp.]